MPCQSSSKSTHASGTHVPTHLSGNRGIFSLRKVYKNGPCITGQRVLSGIHTSTVSQPCCLCPCRLPPPYKRCAFTRVPCLHLYPSGRCMYRYSTDYSRTSDFWLSIIFGNVIIGLLQMNKKQEKTHTQKPPFALHTKKRSGSVPQRINPVSTGLPLLEHILPGLLEHTLPGISQIVYVQYSRERVKRHTYFACDVLPQV